MVDLEAGLPRSRTNSDGFYTIGQDEAIAKPKPEARALNELDASGAGFEKEPDNGQAVEQGNLKPVQDLKVEMLTSIVIDNNYMQNSHLGEWTKVYQEYQFGPRQYDLRAELPVVH